MAVRVLRRQPLYAWAAITVMTLAVAAVTAVFSVLHGVLLTPLPYREPDRVALLRADLQGYEQEPLLTSMEFAALRDRTDLFEGVAAIVEANGSLTTPGEMEPLSAAAISDNFFEVLGIAPLLGRSVTSADTRVVAIGYDFWQRRFNGDPAIIGRRIDIDSASMLVVGVLPAFQLQLGPGVRIPAVVDVFYPRGRGYENDPFRGNVVIARLGSGIAPGAADAAVHALGTNLAATQPARYQTGPVRLSLHPLDREVARQARPALLAVAGAVAFVLVAACANLANLALVRLSGRGRELAIRASIGASRSQLARQFLAESIVIGGLGAAGGLVVAYWAVDALLLFAPATLPRRDAIVVDRTVAAFAIVVALLSTLLVSAMPLWHAIRIDIAARLKHDAASWASARITRGAMVAAQLALSLVLLAGFGLVARAFLNLRSVPLGFDPARTATMYVSINGQRFGTGTIEEARRRRLEFYGELRTSVRALPGVEQFGVGFPSPMSDITIVQPFVTAPGEAERTAEGVVAFEGFLETLQVPLVEGRLFTAIDHDRPVIIIDEQLARELWPGQSAIGRTLHIIRFDRQLLPREIVGVVRHLQTQGLRSTGLPQIWMTYATRSPAQLNAVVRAEAPLTLMPAIDRAAQRLGSGRPMRDGRLLSDVVAERSADTRFAVIVLGVFGGLALLLAAIGIYAVVANAMVRRTREMAVRVALGAGARRILALAMAETAAATTTGLAAGLAGAFVVTRYLETLLFRIDARDALTFAIAAMLLGAIALAAAALPAVRAARVDPMLAMRVD